jgi:UDPglucose 6-dehydrogenase
MKVAVVGCGYVGLISAVGLAGLGHEVIGIDVDETRLAQLRSAKPPFLETGLPEALREAVEKHGLRFAASLDAATSAEVVLLCVQTPAGPSGAVDLTYLDQAAANVSRIIESGPASRRVLLIRSTVPPGTNATLGALFSAEDTAVVSNPEFLREGSALADFLHADRIVVGCNEGWAAEVVSELYRGVDAPVIVTTPETAELAKYASNALLATLISFSNELGRISEETSGVDVEDVLAIVHRDRRLSVRSAPERESAEIVSYLRVGCGYGGSCLPKDLAALVDYARSQGLGVGLLEAVERVNRDQATHLVDIAERPLGSFDGRTVAVLGAAFKAGTDDLRSSPGLRIASLVAERGALVRIFDPLVSSERLAEVCSGSDIQVAPSLPAAITNVDACIVTTHAPEFAALEQLLDGLSGQTPLVVDGRRSLPASTFASGSYIGIGRSVKT